MKIEHYTAEVALNRVERLEAKGVTTQHMGSERRRLGAMFGAVDLVEEISEGTSLAYPTVFRILRDLTNRAAIAANPTRFIHEASSRIREIELDELLRGLTYAPSGEEFDISLLEPSLLTFADTIERRTEACTTVLCSTADSSGTLPGCGQRRRSCVFSQASGRLPDPDPNRLLQS